MKKLFIIRLMASVTIVGFVFPVGAMQNHNLDVCVTYKTEQVFYEDNVTSSDKEKYNRFGMGKP